jgi:sarcosine oxidase subunit alpha
MHREQITFDFEGRRIAARPGDSIAAALFRAGVRTLSYSVKYKRPRGIHCARGRCVMCHMEVDGVPGVPTCITPAADGMKVRRENYRPFFAPILIPAVRRVSLPAGFYYRMFTRPALIRKLFFNSLRKMAGVGRLIAGQAGNISGTHFGRAAAAPSAASRPMAAYDVVVVGAGISGMSAALAAAQGGAEVLLVDEYARAGGHAIGRHLDEELTSARDELATALASSTSVHHLPETTAQAFYPPDTLLIGPGGSVGATARPREIRTLASMHRVRAPSFIFATGAYDVVPLFEDNDTPGIFGSRALRLFIERDDLRPGSRAVVYGTGSALDETTHYLGCHGIDVAAVVDPAPSARTGERRLPGTTYLDGHRVERVKGGKWVSFITTAPCDGGQSTSLDCDLLCVAFPGQPAYELAYQAGFSFRMSGGPLQETRTMLPTERVIRDGSGVSVFVVGELAGHVTWRERKTSGEEAGSRATQERQASKRE